MAKKRRKDTKVKNSDGITRVKPIKDVGLDEDGRKIQNIAIKRADGSTTTDRYADGEKIGSTYNPKKLRKKKIKKLKVKNKPPKKLKPVPVPSYTAPEVTFDEETQKEADKQEKIAKRKLKYANKKKKKKKFKIKLPKIFKNNHPKKRKVKNLVSGRTNILR